MARAVLAIDQGTTGNTALVIDRDGRVLGRAYDMLSTGGESVHPCEVEDRLCECPCVDEVAIVGRPDRAWGHTLVALVVGGVEQFAFQAWCESHLPSYQKPREMFRMPALPRDSMGKLDRRMLREWVETTPPHRLPVSQG